MRIQVLAGVVGFCATLGLCGGRARADIDLSSARALGMADALRGSATGASAIHLNPSGLSLMRNYVIETGYLFGGSESTNGLDISVSDSITARMAAGVYF